MILPETHAGELVEEVLPDLLTLVAAPHHPNAEALLDRVRRTIDGSFADPDDPDEYERGWTDGAIDTTLRVLLAIAEDAEHLAPLFQREDLTRNRTS